MSDPERMPDHIFYAALGLVGVALLAGLLTVAQSPPVADPVPRPVVEQTEPEKVARGIGQPISCPDGGGLACLLGDAR